MPLFPRQSPILDVTETISDQSGIETVDMELATSDSATSFAYSGDLRMASPIGTIFKQRSCTPVPITFPSMGVMPLGAGSTPNSNFKPALQAFEYISPATAHHAINSYEFPLMELNRVGMFSAFMQRRPRGEKRPIPDEQKDEKYYERRKRNNEAAKKSRDARKIREDRIAFRAALLEQENSILRAQVLALRDELQTVRQLIGAANASVLGVASRAGPL